MLTRAESESNLIDLAIIREHLDSIKLDIERDKSLDQIYEGIQYTALCQDKDINIITLDTIHSMAEKLYRQRTRKSPTHGDYHHAA